MLTIILVVLVAILTLVNLSSYLKMTIPYSRKRHFKEKLETQVRKMWDTEFAKEKYKQVREDMRTEYDRMAENLPAYEERLRKLNERNEPTDAEDIKNTEATLAARKQDVAQLKEQLEGMDAQIKQADDNIDGYRSIIIMIEEFLKTV